MDSSLIEKANDIDDLMEEITKVLPIIFSITPKNEEEEREKFYKNTKYNPQFTYKPFTKDPHELLSMLQDIRIEEKGPLFDLLREKHEYLRLRIMMIMHRATEHYTEFAQKVYGVPDKSLIIRATNIMRKDVTSKREKTFDVKQVLPKFRAAFFKYGIDWKIATKDMVASAAVIGSDRTLYLKKNGKFSKKFIEQLIVHEIGTHVLRVENGSAQPYKIFETGLPGYLATEEGLALYNQEINNCSNDFLMKMYAGRVLAANKALKSSFSETYQYLRKYFSKSMAWKITLRVKRGMGDTSQPGAYTKDYLYLHGYFQIREYLHNKGKLEDLYYGKIGVQHVDLVKKIPDLTHPRYIPLFRYFGFFIHLTEDVLGFPFRFFSDFLLSPLRGSSTRATKQKQKPF